MSEDKYRIDPNFKVPEPTPASRFALISPEEYHSLAHEPMLDRWRADGCKQARVTIVNDEYPHPPYPHGVWFEGWDDERARMLPFGEAGPDGTISPPLTAQAPK